MSGLEASISPGAAWTVNPTEIHWNLPRVITPDPRFDIDLTWFYEMT